MIKLLRLVSGEELLAIVTEETDTHVSIKEPLIMVPTGEGKIGVADYMPYSDITKGVTISRTHIMFILNAVEQMQNAHKERFSAIVTPSSNLVGIK